MADMTPPADAPAFLAAHGWAGAVIAPLAGDASFRRYFRVTDGARRAVLMDARRRMKTRAPSWRSAAGCRNATSGRRRSWRRMSSAG